MNKWFVSVVGAAVMGISIQAQEPTRVPLDDTGIADWRALNPVKPLELGTSELELVNTTGDRTFVVTIPYVYQETEFTSAYSVARQQRAGRSLADMVCRVLGECAEADLRKLQSLEQVKIFMERLARAKKEPAPGTACYPGMRDDCGPSQCSTGCTRECPAQDGMEREAVREDLPCQMERIFWSAACAASATLADLTVFATSNTLPERFEERLREEAQTTVSWIFGDPVAPPVCTTACTKCLFTEVERVLCSEVNATGCPTPPNNLRAGRPNMTNLAEVQSVEALVERFADARFRMTRREVLRAAEEEARGIFASLKPVMDRLEVERAALERRIDRPADREDALIAHCQLRELTVAARLLSSYSAEALVPFEVPTWVLNQPCYREAVAAEHVVTYERYTAPVEQSSRIAANTAGRRTQTLRRAEEERASGIHADVPPADIGILDCNRQGTQVACTASVTIPPNQRATLSRSVLQHHPDPRIRFTVAYFDDTEPPPNNTGYVLRAAPGTRPVVPTKSEFSFGFGADTTTGYDLPAGFQGHARHTGGGGSATTQYRFEAQDKGAVDVSATLRFKQGDFGGARATNEVTASQYHARIAGPGGVIGQFGRMLFARPSAGIAINERGEGLRVARDWAALAYVIRRESDTADNSADAADDDSDLLLLQLTPRIPRIRNTILTFGYGEDKNDRRTQIERGTGDDKRTITQIPLRYWYVTYGADLRVAVPYTNSVVTFAAYHSLRKVYEHSPLETNQEFTTDERDGEGTVALVTWSWARNARRRLTDPPGKTRPSFGATVFAGHGTGDDPNTPERNEGYVGENAGYANDLIFLSQIAANPAYARVIGKGLANKFYVGAQYTDARYSLLEPLAKWLDAEGSIESRNTVVSLHNYWLDHALDERKYAGTELDVEFRLEAPKSVRWFLRGALYRTSRAVESLGRGTGAIDPQLAKNPWLIATGVTLSFEGR